MFQISHLVKEFNSVPAVNDVTTNIDRGEVVFIVGPSGSGKSTFSSALGCTARGTPIPSSFPEAKSSASPSCAPWS